MSAKEELSVQERRRQKILSRQGTADHSEEEISTNASETKGADVFERYNSLKVREKR